MVTDSMLACNTVLADMQGPLEQFDELIVKAKADIAQAVLDKVNDKEFALQLPALVERRKEVILDCSRCDELLDKIKDNSAVAEKALDRKLAEHDKLKAKFDELNDMFGEKDELLGDLQYLVLGGNDPMTLIKDAKVKQAQEQARFAKQKAKAHAE